LEKNFYYHSNNPILNRVNQLPNTFPYVFRIENPSNVTLKVEFGYPFKNINTANQISQPANSVLQTLSPTPFEGNTNSSPSFMLIVEDTNTLWVSQIGAGSGINVYNLSDFSLVRSINLGVGIFPSRLEYNPTNKRVYVSTNTTLVYSYKSTDYLLSTISVGATQNTIIYNPVNTYVYISIPSLNQVSVYDSNDNLITNIGGFNDPRAMAYNSLANTIYVDNFTTPSIDKINCATDTRVALGVATTGGASDLCYVSQQDEIYVIEESSNIIEIIDCTTDTISASIAVSDPFNCAYDSNQDKVYITQDGGTSNLYEIDASTSTLKSTTNIGASDLWGIVYDSKENEIVVSQAPSNPSLFRVTTTGTPIVTSLDNSSYIEFLYEIMEKPILVGMVFIGSSNANQNRQLLTISVFDGNGCVFEKRLQPIRDPYCRLLSVPVPQFFQLDSQSGFTFDLLPKAEVELFIYEVKQIDITDELDVPKDYGDGLTDCD
jgi:hypothetical protein